MKIFNWINIRLFLMFAVVVALYGFASYKNEHRKLIASRVFFIEKNTQFIKQETVNKLLIENTHDLKTIEKDELNLEKLENSINKQPMVLKSEVYVSVDGVLNAKVQQRTPIARVFLDQSSYYIDYQGNKMPLSANYTARVPLVSGVMSLKMDKKLATLLKTIYDDDFLKKNIVGMQILPNQSLIMSNRNYNYQIEFGRIMNVDKKFKNYKAFFQKASQDSTLEKYKKINLKFTQQVVCTK